VFLHRPGRKSFLYGLYAKYQAKDPWMGTLGKIKEDELYDY